MQSTKKNIFVIRLKDRKSFLRRNWHRGAIHPSQSAYSSLVYLDAIFAVQTIYLQLSRRIQQAIYFFATSAEILSLLPNNKFIAKNQQAFVPANLSFRVRPSKSKTVSSHFGKQTTKKVL